MLLLPGGSKESIIAACEYGADAVYFGVGEFNARKNAGNVTFEELYSIVEYIKSKDVQIFITLNIIFKEEELSELFDFLYKISFFDIDGLIIQDFAIKNIVDKFFNGNIPLVSSTQMNINNLFAVKFLEKDNFIKVIFARELSVDEIKNICANTRIKTEIFVHGALCYAYSGICYMSYNIGGRSGNRGECAQSCRLKYIKDGQEGYFLSTRDLCLLDDIDKVKEVNTYKIEGRLKSADYVANCAQVYKGLTSDKNLDLIFHREYSKGNFLNKGSKDVIDSQKNNKPGYFLGKATKYGKYFKIKSDIPLKTGDKLFIEEDNKGFIIKSLFNIKEKYINRSKAGEEVLLKISSRFFELSLYVNSSHVTDVKLPEVKFYKSPFIPVICDIKVFKDELVFDLKDKECIKIPYEFYKALKRPLNQEDFIKVFSKKDNEIFYLDINKIEINDNELFAPISKLNSLRRNLFELLENTIPEKEFLFEKSSKRKLKSVKLNSIEHLKIVKDKKINFDVFYIPVNDITEYISEVIPYFPPVIDSQFIDYEKELIKVKKLGYKKVMGAELGLLYLSKKHELEIILDNFMNISNSQSIEYFSKNNVNTINLGNELTIKQIRELSEYKDIKTEVTIYGRRTSMISVNCVLYNNKECKEKNNCRKVFDITNERKDNFKVFCRDCKNYFYEENIMDIRPNKIIADYLRYDLSGFTIKEIHDLNI